MKRPLPETPADKGKEDTSSEGNVRLNSLEPIMLLIYRRNGAMIQNSRQTERRWGQEIAPEVFLVI